MYTITDDEIDFILGDIEKRGVVTEDVKDNLLDHVCCIIEREMPAEEDFFKFYKGTIARFYQKELGEIEDETRELVTFKYYYAMKRTMKITGFITAFLILVGAIFKTMQWPGAGIAIVIGFAIFSLVFVPLNIVMKFRDDKRQQNRLIMTIGMITIATSCMGMLFKIMHWPYANILMVTGLTLFAALFIPIFFYIKFKDPESRFNGTIQTVFMLAGAGMLFAMINLGKSHNVTDSINSMFAFQEENIQELSSDNEAMYSEVLSENEELFYLQELTAELTTKIKSIRKNLIAKSNGIKGPVPENLEVESLQNPNDDKVVRKHFENTKGDLSYLAFQEAVKTYNSGLNQIDAVNTIRPIDIEKLQMTETIVSVVLQQLSEIEIQALANENSYLSLHKGLMAAK